jgi:myo-inositol 2-dehydrogenase/D-chiro-inositol 1-dehydrogenase
MTDDKPAGALDRRAFMARAGTAALGWTILRPGLVLGSGADSKISLGIIGCGGRGSWLAGLFAKHGGYTITAAADYFPERAAELGAKFGIPEARRFSGLLAYKRLLEAGVDAVAVESPPWFHPAQAAAAVDAGVHVYLAKPAAVDVPGCLKIAAAGLAR